MRGCGEYGGIQVTSYRRRGGVSGERMDKGG